VKTALLAERYDLERTLGQGGGGEVWAARDCATGATVALKILRGQANPTEVEALIRETTALSGLEGLGFPRVLALGRAPDGRLFLVRELVDGDSLEAIGAREPARALSLLPRLADVLTVVHRTGLLHGDVKPANVIVREHDQVALVDLGLATALRAGGEAAFGLTPHFAAPEVLAGGRLTVQAEIHALGVMLSDFLASGAAHAASPETQQALRAVVLRAMDTAPSSRYPSADEFGLALQRALGSPRAEARPITAPWPILGMEAWAYGLRRVVDALPFGGVIDVTGPRGSGRSTLVRRSSWTLALEGRRVALVDAAVVASPVLEAVLAPAAQPGGVVFWDADGVDPGAWGDRIVRSGARLVRVLSTGTGAPEFSVPALDETSVRTLLKGVLPGLPAALVGEVVAHVGARPLALRNWAWAARDRPLVGVDDVRAVLSHAGSSSGTAASEVEASLDRGHYSDAQRRLSELEPDAPLTALLRARYEIAAGSAEEAERLLDAALAAEQPHSLRERLVVTRGRALLGRGLYDRALDGLSEIEGFERAARTEGLAYRGLSLTLLGRAAEALPLLRDAEASAEILGSPRLRALTATSLATAQWRDGDLSAATRSYERSIAAAGDAGDAGMLASAQINLAGLKKEAGDLAASIELLESAEDGARRAGRKASLQQALLNLMNADLYLGRLERARAQLARLGDPDELPAALRAQSFGLRAELHARALELDRALPEFDACAEAFERLGRRRDASEALLESALLLVPGSAEGSGARTSFVATEEQLRSRVEHGRELLDGEVTPLLRLSEARLLAFQNEPGRAEELAREARQLAEALGHKEWAWRALALESELLEAAGKRTRASRARADAVEVLEEIGARLPPDLREVYWSEPRRRSLRVGAAEAGNAHRVAVPPQRELAVGTGTEAVSRLTQTPLERRLARILAINSDLAGEIDLDRLATKIVGHAAELLGAERGYLLLGSSADDLRICASRWGQGDPHQEFSRSIARQVLETGKALVSIDAGRDQRLRSFESVHAALIEAVACVPILSPSGVAIGALYLETRLGTRPDFGDEMPTLQAFADQAAIALENARLLAELAEKGNALELQNRELSDTQARLKELLGRRTARLKEVRQELRSTRDKLTVAAGFRGLVGQSQAMRRIYALIERVQETDVPVLITGESGTGKEVVARAIHEGSARKNHALLAVNCGAIPETILESELFGHKRGAFTGADRDRKGLFQEASSGTLFLDEIGETPLKMQAGLLRVLQEQRVRPVGGSEEVPIDVRVIFATNRHLASAVQQGTFREDLLYRIQVVEIALPPLRERPEDIPLLVDHFLGRLSVRFGQEKKTVSREALRRLSEHPLPGNVRQLENCLLNAWVLSESSEIDVSDINLPRASADSFSSAPVLPRQASEKASHPSVPPAPSSVDRSTFSEHQVSERQQIIEALERTGWNRVRAAEVLDMPRRTLYRRLREYGIQ